MRQDKNNRLFGRHGVYTCGMCNKPTRETGGDESNFKLCHRCMLVCYVDNAESDFGADSKEAQRARTRLAEYDAKH